MTVADLIAKGGLEVLNLGEGGADITGLYCCDLLSFVMGKAFAGCVWVTVMGNVNSIAVAALTEAACIVLADGVQPDEMALSRAKQQGITLLRSKQPIFETALSVYEALPHA